MAPLLNSQGDTGTRYRVDVDMVVLTFSVTDKKGNHVNGLRPEDIRIFEDGAEQKISSFAEGSKLLVNEGRDPPAPTYSSCSIRAIACTRAYLTCATPSPTS